MAAGSRSSLLLRNLADHRFGGEHQARDRSRVLQGPFVFSFSRLLLGLLADDSGTYDPGVVHNYPKAIRMNYEFSGAVSG